MKVRKTCRIGSCKDTQACLLELGLAHCRALRLLSASFAINFYLSMIFLHWGFLGNLVIYFQFTGKTYIDADTRDLVIVFINVVVLLGTFLILFLPLYEKEDLLELGSKEICQGGAEADSVQSRQAKDSALIQSIESPLKTLKKGLKIMTSPDVLLLLVLFINIGFSYIFTIVYNTCLGFTRTIPNSIEMLPIAGLMSGFGGMVDNCVQLYTD
ncbi:hypothetical protein M8J77_001618 [Diaphorina citri]|nr:hypothetical protein M8J77_001618 [Diaphorina citri]